MTTHDQFGIVGPIGIRRFVAEKRCVAYEGHSHNYDHTTVVVRGRIRVTVERDGASELLGEFAQAGAVEIKAGLVHTIKPLDDDTVWLCIFSHRDFDGLVTQEYHGNLKAYA